jgi:hypothetical protein
VIDAQFGDSLSHRPHITGIAGRESLYTDLHTGSRPQIAQVVEPLRERLSLPELGQAQL